MLWALSIVAAIHGLLHFIGFKKLGAWLIPVVLWLVTAVMALAAAEYVWIPGPR